MNLLGLPNEILLKIFSYGGPDALVGGPSQTCRVLREISNDPQLWNEMLAPQFKSQFLTPAQIEHISDLREWCLKQRVATKRTLDSLDELVHEFRELTPGDLEIYSWKILKHRLRATEGLTWAGENPQTLAHYHWAHWLKEVMYRLEGLHMLLKLSTKDSWGNGAVENPIEQVIALYTLRMGKVPVEIFDAVYNDSTAETNNEVKILAEKDLNRAAEVMVTEVLRIFDKVSARNDFLAVLGRGSLFITLWSKIGLSSRLLKLPFGSYVCINVPNSDPPAQQQALFVDFQRRGKLRTMSEIRDRLHVMGVTDLQYGLSLYDTLSTCYVWHTAPTSTRHCVLDLIEHAASEVKVTPLNAAPNLYTNLVYRIIKRNISEVENAPLSRAVSSASLVSMAGTSPGGWLQKGKVVQVLVNQNDDTSDGDASIPLRYGVVLELGEGSVLVQINGTSERVIHSMVQPAPHIPLTTVAGLPMPDIDLDIMSLGQHFINYSIPRQRFE